ncbi:MAG: Ig-like domain-containing protein [Gemmatimonadota bacterium]
MRRVLAGCVVLTGVLIAYACSGDKSSSGPTGPSNPVPAAIAQSGTLPADTVVASVLTAAVKVTDSGGAGMSGVAVHWSVAGGGGSVGADSSTTNGSGVASVSWTLGTTAGENRLSARAGSLSALTLTTTATPDRAAVVTLSNDTLSFGALGDTLQLTATVADEYGNAVDSPAVTWAVADPSIATVDSTGRVVSLTEGQTSVTATADTASSAATVLVHQQAALVTIAPVDIALTAAGDTVRLSAAAKDANGNVVPGSVTWSNDNASVVSVTTDGLVQAQAEGTANVIATSGPIADTVAVVVYTSRGVTRTWTGAVDAVWADPLDWQPAGATNGQDTVAVAAVSNEPVLGADAAVGPLTVQSAASVGLAGFGLTANGDVVATGPVNGTGLLTLAGTGAALEGTVPSILVTGTVSLAGATQANAVTIQGGSLTIQGQTLTISP